MSSGPRLRRSGRALEWQVPEFPLHPQDPPEVQCVENAYLSRVEHGPLRTIQQPTRYLRGAVYDAEDRLVVASQKMGGLNNHPWVPADPGRIKRVARAKPLAGTWLYGGHWFQHFGHFLIEGITTLWHSEPETDGLIFHKYLKRPAAVEPWMTRLLELNGNGGLPIEIVEKGRDYEVERLVVPSRTVVANGWGHPEAVAVWDRVATACASDSVSKPAAGAKVFFSRTAFNQTKQRPGRGPRSTSTRDQQLDEIFARNGFEVVFPETLDVEEQIRTAANASVIAGNSGSALHLSAFAGPNTRVLELGDRRNPHEPLAMQRIIDALRGHQHAFVPPSVTLAELDRRIRRV